MGELRHALRLMRRAPGFTAAALLTLALGVGVNTAVFSLIRAVLLRPLRYHEPERSCNRRFAPSCRP
jgi:putative ABC transport system permease protein